MNTSNPLSHLFINSVTHRTEWAFMWAALVAHWRGDTCDLNPIFSECWQYMGSTFNPVSRTWEHAFRHRIHPRTKRREYWRTPASDAFNRAHAPAAPARHAYASRFDPAHCSGAFDGFTVTSDADEGL